MLAQSGPVENYEWEKYEFKLFPPSSHTYFTIEAFFIDGVEAPYNGHVLVDNFSSIREISCQ